MQKMETSAEKRTATQRGIEEQGLPVVEATHGYRSVNGKQRVHAHATGMGSRQWEEAGREWEARPTGMNEYWGSRRERGGRAAAGDDGC